MLIPLTNTPRDYAWGSTTLLAELEGRPAAAVPEAEVWFGDHPADPAELGGGRTLRDLTGGELPYLLKLLAARLPLSIQVHPTIAQAREGFAREEAAGIAADDPVRNYRDRNHKPELVVALRDGFEALVGLRPLEDTRRLLAGLGDSAGLARLREALAEEGDPLRTAITWALTEAGREEVAEITEAVRAGAVPGFEGALAAVARAAEENPGDAGVIVALLMNHAVLAAGEALFLPAGVLHAYLRGIAVEIMAASDNVLRGGLTPKHVDVPELLRILDSTPAEVPVLGPGASDFCYPVPIADFALRRLELDAEPVEAALAGPAIVLVTAGEVGVGEGLLTAGEAVFAEASESVLRLRGPGQVFIAQPG